MKEGRKKGDKGRKRMKVVSREKDVEDSLSHRLKQQA
jgi:hypothetical protein